MKSAADAAAGSDPAWLTLVVAIFALLSTLATALVALRAAQATKSAAASASIAATSAADAAAEAAKFVAGSDRFADWQMYKRKVYAALLSSMRAAVAPDAAGLDKAAVLDCFDAALLAAYPITRPPLQALRAEFESNPRLEVDHEAYIQLVSLLNQDVELTPSKARKLRALSIPQPVRPV